MMQAGRLRQRVTIQERTVSQDALGQAVESWGDLATDVPADVRMSGLRGQEQVIRGAGQEIATLTHKVQMRYRSDVTPAMRIIYGSKTLEIVSAADPDGRGRELVCLCVEHVDR